MLAAGWISAQLLFWNFFNVIIKITFCVHMGILGLATATSSSERWSEFLEAGSALSCAARWGFLLPQALGDALQVGAISSASVLTQPRMLCTPCLPFSGQESPCKCECHKWVLFHSFLPWLFFVGGLSWTQDFLRGCSSTSTFCWQQLQWLFE